MKRIITLMAAATALFDSTVYAKDAPAPAAITVTADTGRDTSDQRCVAMYDNAKLAAKHEIDINYRSVPALDNFNYTQDSEANGELTRVLKRSLLVSVINTESSLICRNSRYAYDHAVDINSSIPVFDLNIIRRASLQP